MKILSTLVVLISTLSAQAFYAFDFGFRDMPPAEQTRFLAEAGFDGIATNVANAKKMPNFEALLQAPEVLSGKIKVVAVYYACGLNTPTNRALVSSILKLSAAQKIPLWLSIKSEEATEEKVVALIQSICDEAAPLGINIVLYAHDNHYMPSAEDSLRLIKAAKRLNLFASLNLHQELRAGNAGRLDEVVRLVAPYAALAQVSGANLPAGIMRGAKDWSDVVQPLASSAFDVEAFYALLVKYGYKGPIGLQNNFIPGDPKPHHLASIALLKQWEAKYRSVK